MDRGKRMELVTLLDRKDIPEDAKNIIKKTILIQKKASIELSASQRALISLMNVNTESSILLDTDGIIIAINEVAAKRIGSNTKDLIGKCIFDFFSQDTAEQRKQHCQNAISTKKSIRFEDKRNDIMFDSSIYPVLNESGQVEYLAVFSSDVTTQRKVEQAIIESEKRYRKILDSIEEGYFEVDLAGNMTFFNESTCKILRYSRDKLMGMNYQQFVDIKTAKSVFQVFNEVYTTKIPTKIFDWEIIRKDGVRRFIETSVSLMTDTNDEAIGFRGVVRDVTERKMVEFALKESEEKYRNLVERANDGITIMQDKLLKYVNPSLARILGYSVNELVNTIFTEHLHPDELPILLDRYNRRMMGEDMPPVYESRLKSKEGSFIDVEINAGLITFQNRPADLVLIRDITERKQAERALKEAKEKYQMLIEKMEEGVILEDPKGIATFVNPKFANTLGYKPDELIGKHWSFVVAEESQAKVEKETVKRPDGIGSVYEAYGKTKNDTRVPFRVSATPIISKSGIFKGTLSVLTDISDLKKTENELRESKEKYQMLVEKMEEGVNMEDEHGILRFINPGFIKMIGYAKEEIIGNHYTNFIHKQYIDRAKFETAKRPKGVTSTYECLLIKKDNSLLPVIITATPLFSNDNKYKGTLTVVTDITIQKKTEMTLKQTKLEEERYHAMMGHFVNNNLQKIISNIELISMHNKDLHKNNFEEIINITHQTSRTIDIVNKIFDVLQSPSFEFNKKKINLFKVIREIIEEFPNMQNNISLEFDSLNVLLYTDKYLKDIFYELILYIVGSISNKIEPRKSISIKGYQYLDYYCVSISDNMSTPISEDLGIRLTGIISDQWESKGHHIGIALVSVIMQYYKGILKIHPIIPKGNIFNLMFPLSLMEYSNEN